ncbi:MAG: hypothetical protein PHY14_02260 [Candidatus Gracilibacteria bacterium]|nr:hypothetical protein [Candidatus Gracilibacteria bacterium]
MKTLIFIHGGESFSTHAEYLDWIENTYPEWMLDAWAPQEEKSDWKVKIAEQSVMNGNIVYMPQFPNKLNAKYSEWKIFFDAWIEKIPLSGEIIFIGNSLGGCFLLKYFSELSSQDVPFVIPTKEESLSNSSYENLGSFSSIEEEKEILTVGQKKISIDQIHLLAACISEGNFTPPDNYEFLQKIGNRVHIWHSEDDAVVPFSVGQELMRILPEAQIHFFSTEKGYGHFHGIERIPELEREILK